MRLGHYETYRPVCVRCRGLGRGDLPLALTVLHRVDDDVVDGMLTCPECRYEYPILRGIPMLVPDVRDHVARLLGELRAADDLSEYVESVLGDCAGPEGEYGRNRHYVSSYGLTHWGDLAPAVPGGGGLVPVIAAALELAGEVRGRWLDLGCSLGRGAFELAARTGQPVVGIDINLAMLRAARRIVIDGRLRHPVRRVGVVYDRREAEVDRAERALVDVWFADATALPFADGAASGALSLGLLDSVQWPLVHLHELARVLVPGGRAVIATPYDWTLAVTPLEGWLGGHSQRGPLGGSSAAELRRLLAAEGRPEGAPALYIDAERADVPWATPLHERATVEYRLDMVRVRRPA
jgi:SAM-dependent methyltransferase